MAKAYYSFNIAEVDILCTRASADELQLYFLLRRYADFHTGRITHPAAPRLSLAFLAEILCRKSSAGRQAVIVHKEEIRRRLRGLMELGLVTNLGKRIADMVLAMVGTQRNDVKNQITQEAEAEQQRLCRITSENPPRLCRESDPQVIECKVIIKSVDSRLCRITSKNPPRLCREESDESAETLAVTGFPPSENCSFSTQSKESVHPLAFQAGENPKSPSALENQRHLKAETGKPEKIANSQESRFEAFVQQEGQGRILWCDSKISRAIYARWNAANVTQSDLRDAIGVLLTHPERHQTTNGIDDILRGRRSLPRARPGKGDICL